MEKFLKIMMVGALCASSVSTFAGNNGGKGSDAVACTTPVNNSCMKGRDGEKASCDNDGNAAAPPNCTDNPTETCVNEVNITCAGGKGGAGECDGDKGEDGQSVIVECPIGPLYVG